MIQIYFKITATVRPVYTNIDSVPCDGYGFLFRSLQHIQICIQFRVNDTDMLYTVLVELYRYLFSSLRLIQIFPQFWSNYTDMHSVPYERYCIAPCLHYVWNILYSVQCTMYMYLVILYMQNYIYSAPCEWYRYLFSS